ncbi:hypothetical protein [Planococcus donghaensis]|uniref:Uncharacterized protein n=1 Tax=Planococcus donghaensis TaxID=414778 RepID=A0A1C7EJD4_9BACL|nr:hypothetical protein [Planococcus donghaensis]ANU23845.1 hypothetical protein BCM40_10910 [Planococcus donghaensis]
MKLKHFIIVITIISIVIFLGSLTVNGLVTYWGNSLKWGSGSRDIWIGFWGSILGGLVGSLAVIFTTYYLISNEDRKQRDLILLNLEIDTIKQINTNLSTLENSFNKFSELAEEYIYKVGKDVSTSEVAEIKELIYKELRKLDKLTGRFYNNESFYTEDMSIFSNLLSDFRRNVKYIGWKVRDCNDKNASKTLEDFIELNNKVEEIVDGLIKHLSIRHLEEYIKFSEARGSKKNIRDSFKSVLSKIIKEEK